MTNETDLLDVVEEIRRARDVVVSAIHRVETERAAESERVPHPLLTPICKNCAHLFGQLPGMVHCPKHGGVIVQPYETCDQFNPKRTGDR